MTNHSPAQGRTPPISTIEAAAYLGTTKRHIDRLVHEHRLAFLKVGGKRRFLVEDLDAFLAASRVEAVRR